MDTRRSGGEPTRSRRLAVSATNDLDAARHAETLEIPAADLAPLCERDLAKLRVLDEGGAPLVCQALDADGDGVTDLLVFQAEFAAGQSRTFTVVAGDRAVHPRDEFRVYGRFVRERCDDFCWENDRIAHRMYGRALETAPRIPLISSTVDIWSKRTSRLVINDWYLVDDYHGDTGEGGDFYSAGQSRGCGGNGLWAADRLWVSRNFVDSRVLACGPIRLLFELVYEPFDVDGVPVSEVKRIALDAGQHLNHFRSIYRPAKPLELRTGIGLKKVAGERVEFSAGGGWLAAWEPMEMDAGEQGLAIVVDPAVLERRTDDRLNHLLVAKVPGNATASYWAGFCWNRAGQFTDGEAWKAYVDRFARGRRSPLRISVSAA